VHPLFVGNHPAIDFLNTAFATDGEPVEMIENGKAYLEWLVTATLMKQPLATKLARRFGAKALDDAAEEARKIREWARGWLSRWRASPNADYVEEMMVLNELLSRTTYSHQLVATQGESKLAEIPDFKAASALVALVAMQFAVLITQERPDLIKECASSTCTLWFLDQSKAHRRLFCSPIVCGNRAKVAAFRERQRAYT
jgi:predicted RNA-binding Zn ribbon-like protein